MKMKWFALVAVVGFAEIYSSQAAECEGGTTWTTGCYDCTCSEAGRAVCTPLPTCDVAINTPADIPHCQPGSRWKDDCNTCFCTFDGVAACTKIGCVSIKPPGGLNFDDTKTLKESVSEGEQRVIEKECRPREVFELDCNTCRCNDDGKSFNCTGRGCFTDPPPDEVFYEIKNSPPVESRDKRQTESSKSDLKVCEAGVQFRQDCNTCLCHTDGLSFSCTRHECHKPPQQNPAPPSTRRRRRRRRREVAKKEARDCEPGSVFEQGCNVCICASDGQHATCALKRCPITHKDSDDKVVETDTGFRCTAGEQFKRACNDCTCSADGKSIFCTIKLCEKEIESQL